MKTLFLTCRESYQSDYAFVLGFCVAKGGLTVSNTSGYDSKGNKFHLSVDSDLSSFFDLFHEFGLTDVWVDKN